MSRKGRIAAAVLSVTGILALAPASSAIEYDLRPTHYTFGVRAGFVYGANLEISGHAADFNGEYKFDTEMGLSAGILFDVPLSPKYMAGLALDLDDIKVEEIRKKFLDASVTLKRVIEFPGPNFSLRVGGAVGLGYLGPDFGAYHFKPTTFLTLKATLEGVFPINLRYAWLVDFSVLRVPTGGNVDVRANYGPTVIGRFGILM